MILRENLLWHEFIQYELIEWCYVFYEPCSTYTTMLTDSSLLCPRVFLVVEVVETLRRAETQEDITITTF
jgi:hypothetical protein